LLVDLFRMAPAAEVSLPAGPAPATKAFLHRILEREGSERIWPSRLAVSNEG
jgi:hypothetical protein